MKDMNRIIIVGNGFDLAHGLKTKYEDFINWYWDKWGQRLRSCGVKSISDGLCSFVLKDEVGLAGWYLVWSYHYGVYPANITDRQLLEQAKKDDKVCDYKMHSTFFSKICNSIETKGWVDIEADYYAMLVEYKGKKDELEKLNKDFVVIQGLLVKYLKEIQKNEINEELVCDDIKSKMLAPFVAKDISVEAKDKWTDFLKRRYNDDNLKYNIEFYKPLDAVKRAKTVRKSLANDGQIRAMGIETIPGEFLPPDMLYPDCVMLLNFNYTNTADLYFDDEYFIINHIHGDLSLPESVIFGYGDESDDEYKKLQKINDNEYLRHIKTNRYLETPNYRDLLSFIDSAPFQVCIMGHSCGLSDKTLLNTLFEHKNCVSIKPYYYVNEQGKDNYLDIVQNISRNFTNPQLMRDRVVNKTYCSALPQKTKN